jgi:hypothetical protein
MYEHLWAQLREFIDEEGCKKSFGLSTNGSQYERTVARAAPSGRHNNEEDPVALNVRLVRSPDHPLIKANGPGVDLEFDLGVGADGVMRLELAGTTVSLEEAAIKILDPFLFPDLPRKY